MRCNNCDTDVTPLWRKGVDGVDVCNACGLYYKIHGVNRPKSMKKDEVRQRQRVRKGQLSTDYHDSAYNEVISQTKQKSTKKALIKIIDVEINEEKNKAKKNQMNKRKSNKENQCINLAEYKKRTKSTSKEKGETAEAVNTHHHSHIEEDFHSAVDYVQMFASAVNCFYDDSFDYDILSESSGRRYQKIKSMLYEDEQFSDFVIRENEIECTKIEESKDSCMNEAEMLAIEGLLSFSKIIK